ncbi:acyl-CoA dehydrogenase [Gordonia sinesedis]
MSLATSAEQLAVCDAITAWAARHHTTELVRADLDKPRDQWCELYGGLADLGVFAAALPESAGGLGGSVADVAAMLDACGYALVPGPVGATVTATIALAASGHPRAGELVELLADGQRPAVVPAAAWADGPAPVLRDGRLDLGMVAGCVDDAVILTPVAIDDGAARWSVVAPGTGVRNTVPENVIDGTAGAGVARVTITDLTAADLVDVGNDALIRGLLSATLAAYQAGVARWCLDTAVAYAATRTQFGAPIGSFQAIKHLCADMLCRSEQLTAAAWDVALATDDVLGAAESSSATEQLALSRLAADIAVADLAVPVAEDCIQILGGIGFTFEHDAHLYLRSALAARIVLGHAGRQRAALARLGLAGARRRFEIDLSAAEHRRTEVRAAIADIAAAPDGDERRRRLARSGYLAPHWPAPYGLAADPALQLLIDVELDRAGIDRPDLVIGAWAIPTILAHGTAEQRDRFVLPTLDGDIVWCQLFSEPEAGSDLASLRTRAIRVDGGWRLTGQKIWTSQAHNAQWGICLARTDSDAPKHRGITYFLVDMAAGGIDIRPLRELTGRANFNEVFLDDVFVPDDQVVGEVNGGWRLARTTLANERVAMGGTGLGKEMDTLLREVAQLTAEPTTAQIERLGTLVADAHLGRVLDARAVTQRLAGHDPGALSSVRKLIGVAHRQSVPDLALELLGPDALAAGEAADLVLQNRCLSIAGGTTQILRTAAAERILGLPRA